MLYRLGRSFFSSQTLSFTNCRIRCSLCQCRFFNDSSKGNNTGASDSDIENAHKHAEGDFDTQSSGCRSGAYGEVRTAVQPLADESIARLFQDGMKRKSVMQMPGKTASAQTTTAFITASSDEDFDGLHYVPQTAAASPVTLETMEQELLDDAFLYFPPVSSVEGETGTSPSGKRYVPGQQIVPPGFSRYRVDVQYQGNDFDGWWKSTERRLCRREVGSDGAVRRVAIEDGGNPVGALQDGAMSSRYHARTVLEEALSVALDVSNVKVVAGVIPEIGVSVRRLCCHVDIPSHIELQPRTVIQRATMWMDKRQQPLAILSFHRCKNQDFHARHSGLRRVYVYRILNRVAPPLFDAGLQWHVDRHLDVERMQRFAKTLEGTMDYGYFADPKMANALRRCALSPSGLFTGAISDEHYQPTATGNSPRDQRGTAPKINVEKGLSNLERATALPTFNEYGQRVVQPGAKAKEYHRPSTNLPTVRTIDRLDVVRQDDEVLIWFVGKSFLRHQIRNMVSVLKAAGHGLWNELELQQALKSGFETSRKRFQRERLPAAPVYGLTLWDVEYPEQHRDDFVQFVDSGPYEEVNIAQDI